jgi:aminoglycoside phosphotransferase (APT) family kinase protein
MEWYLAYNMFRLAAIRQGIAARQRQGSASNPRAVVASTTIRPLAERALVLLGRSSSQVPS